jgi:hypothetical protein
VGRYGRPCRVEAQRRRIDRRGWRVANHISGVSFPVGAGRETHPAATETVALPKLRGDLRPFAVAAAFSPNPLAFNVIHKSISSHGENLTKRVQNQKTYRRLFGMIFLGGSGSLLMTYMQWLATHKIFKNRQNSKKSVIFLLRNIDFSAKTPQKRPVFLSVLILCKALEF